jgi:hypothetical protein
MKTITRRGLLGGAAAALAATALRGRSEAQPMGERPYLFVIAAMGGASVLDSFLPVGESESPNGRSLAAVPDSMIRQPPGSGLRCVAPMNVDRAGYRFGNGYSQEDFLRRHGEDLAVMQTESTSVNHAVAQYRALTGDGCNRGRTIAEAAAARWGMGLPIADCNMAGASYALDGSDRALPVEAQQVAVTDPRLFALATHGQRGVANAPAPALVDRARALRDRLEAASPFGRTYGRSAAVARYLQLRQRGVAIERDDLISRLLVSGGAAPLEDFGLTPSPYAARLREVFPLLDVDPFEAQAALAFLMARYDVACAMTLSPDNSILTRDVGSARTVINTQLAFDYSHSDHRVAQSVMWSRLLKVIDGLVTLLKAEHVGGDPARPTLWSRSVVYVATEFGRDKSRESPGAEQFGTGHHQNNGVLVLSPRVRGNRAYGGVDRATLLTHGFDRSTGAPAPGTVMSMRDAYGAVAAALGVEYEGRADVPCMLRA